MAYSKEEHLEMYGLLNFGRFYESKIPELLEAGEISGIYHLSIGQEAIQMALHLEMGPEDWASPHPRCHPFYALKSDPVEFTKELIGRRNNINGGLGSASHFFYPDARICPANGVLGQNVAIAAGFSLAQSDFDHGNKGCVIIGCGDGTLEQGAVAEVLNIIATANLKVCFIIETNNISFSTRKDAVTNLSNPGDRAKGYNMPVKYCDGNDILECREMIHEGIRMARTGIPNVISMKTFRMRGHYEGDPAEYRHPDDIKDAMERDPITRYRDYMIEKGIASPAELKEIEAKQKDVCENIWQEALKSEAPGPEDVINPGLVYAD